MGTNVSFVRTCSRCLNTRPLERFRPYMGTVCLNCTCAATRLSRYWQQIGTPLPRLRKQRLLLFEHPSSTFEPREFLP